MKRAEEDDLKRPKKKSYGFLSHEERADTSNEDQKIILSPHEPNFEFVCQKDGARKSSAYRLSYL